MGCVPAWCSNNEAKLVSSNNSMEGPGNKKTWPQHGGQLRRTLLSHRCWRFFPYLSVKLPEILLGGGSLNGVMLEMTFLWRRATQPLAGDRLEQVATRCLATTRKIQTCHACFGTAYALGQSGKALFQEQDDGCHTAHEQTCAASIGQRLAKRR